MRLVWLADYGGPYPGSMIPLLLATLTSARKRGWEVAAGFGAVASGRPWLDQLDAAAIPVVFAPSGLAARTRWIRKLLAERDSQTVLHTHFTGFDAPAALATLGGAPRSAVFWHVHTGLNSSALVKPRNLARFGLLGRTVAGIFTPSSDLRQQVISRGAPAARVNAIPNGLDTKRFSLRAPDDRELARRKLSLPTDATVLLHFGRDWYIKGGDLFLDAVRLLLDGSPRALPGPVVALTSQGGEPAHNLSQKLGIADHVQVIGPRDDVETLHAAADVVLATSRAEGDPFAVAEALSRGIPVVATDIPGHARAARATEACRVVPARPGAIAAATLELLERDPAIAALQAQQGHDWTAAERGLDAWGERMVDLYCGQRPEATIRG